MSAPETGVPGEPVETGGGTSGDQTSTVERTTAVIDVAAAPEQVMEVVAAVETYPEWVDSVESAEVLSRSAAGRPERVRFRLDAGVVTDDYVLRYSWSADGRSVEWGLESSTLQRDQVGAYRLTAVPGGTRVDYELTVELVVPTIGSVRRRAERRIVGIAVAELKRRAEAAAGA